MVVPSCQKRWLVRVPDVLVRGWSVVVAGGAVDEAREMSLDLLADTPHRQPYDEGAESGAQLCVVPDVMPSTSLIIGLGRGGRRSKDDRCNQRYSADGAGACSRGEPSAAPRAHFFSDV